MLIIFSGLPGTGKTTLSKQVAQQLKAFYLRIDTIEQALQEVTEHDLIGPEGYEISYAIARDNLRLGNRVIADSVNPISLTRQAWRQVAQDTNSKFVEIELICSDKSAHQQRIESRTSDIIGFKLPTWDDVINRDYEPWAPSIKVVDTAKYSIEQSVQLILNYILSVH